jgi:outer membrane protein OmpA-like peptidoglycan-associated protein
MFSSRIILKRGTKDEAEKPFWISYADLMTSLMVLFLVVMSVALLAVTKKLDESTRLKQEREQEIQELLRQVKQAESDFPGIKVDEANHLIDFGPQAFFKFKEYSVTPESATRLRAFTRRLLDIARQPLGVKWLKRIVIEGYTDRRGTYLYNLNLSLNRSHRVMCVLLGQPLADPNVLTIEEQEEVRKLFLVGGYSSNSAKNTDEESRRIELRLEFLALDENRGGSDELKRNLGECQLDLIRNDRAYRQAPQLAP